MAREQRRLAAIVKARRRELIDPKIAEYGGRIVKTTGDGLLLKFLGTTPPSMARSTSMPT
jgi:adenylate cyclase